MEHLLGETGAGGARLALVSGEAGVGKTHLVREFLRRAGERGALVLEGKCLKESLAPYMPLLDALRSGNLGHLCDFERPPLVESVFFISRSGLVMARVGREKGTLDAEIFSGMLTAISAFLRDSLARMRGPVGDAVQVIAHGEYRVLFESRQTGTLALILEGMETERLKDELAAAFDAIEKDHGGLLHSWDGRASDAAPLAACLQPFISVYDGVEEVKRAEDRRWRLFYNVARGMARAAEARPVILFLDDLQWCDQSSLSLTEHLLRNCREKRLLVVGSYREEEVGDDHPLMGAKGDLAKEVPVLEIHLARFGPAETQNLLREWIGTLADSPLGGTIARESGGNAFFARELVELLRSEDMVLARPAEEVRLPARVRDAIAARVGRLGSGQRELLETAAVIGEFFRPATLSCVTGLNRLRLLRDLHELEVRHHLVRESGDRYAFDHPKIREVLYEGLGGGLRTECHRAVAECLDGELRGGANVLMELAYHAPLGNHPGAGEFLRRAGDAARDEFNSAEARRLYAGALELAKGEELPGIYEALGEVEYLAACHEAALGWFVKAAVASASEDGRVALASKRARVLDRLGRYDEGMAALDGHAPSAATSARARCAWLTARAWLAQRLMLWEEAEGAARAALDEPTIEPGDAADCWNAIGSVCSHLGRYRESGEHLRRGMEVAERGKARYQTVRLSFNRAMLLASEGRFDESLAAHNATAETARRTGNSLFERAGDVGRGIVLYQMGRYGEAIEACTRGLKAAPEGHVLGMVDSLRFRALALLETGDGDGANRDIREAVRLGKRSGGLLAVTAGVDLVEVLSATGRLTDAEVECRVVLADLEKAGYRSVAGRCVRNLGRVEALLGKREAAADAFGRMAMSEKEMERFDYAKGLRWWGDALASWGEKERAVEKMEEAGKRLADMGAAGERAKVEKALADLGSGV